MRVVTEHVDHSTPFRDDLDSVANIAGITSPFAAAPSLCSWLITTLTLFMQPFHWVSPLWITLLPRRPKKTLISYDRSVWIFMTYAIK